MSQNQLWTKGHKIDAVDLVNEEGKSFDLKYLVGFIKYYEDVIDPAIHVEISIQDTNGLINKIPIRGGNLVRVKLKHPSQEGFVEKELVVTNISNHIIDQKREVFTLTCETLGALSNHTNRCWIKYKGSIAATVSKILNEKVNGKIHSVDTTSNNCEFYGNYRRPFKVISDLCRKAIPTTGSFEEGNGGTAGYLFFETQDGYNFRSIDSIFGEEPELEYLMTPYKGGLDTTNNFKLSSDPVFRESHDIIKKLRSGAYSSSNWYYDVLTRKVHFYNFKVGDYQLGNEDELNPLAFKEPYSRIILGTIDKGTTNKDADGVTIDTPQDQARYQAQASARYAAMFSQILDITVPMNLSLRAGMVIDVKFPDLNTGEPQDKNSTESGKYMIAKLSHEFGNTAGDFTGLSLVRDSFTINE